jgi:hypothetical protein
MAIVVLGQHDCQRAQDGSQPRRGSPPQIGGVPPPYVELTGREAGQDAGPGEAPEQRSNDEIRDCTEETVEEYGGIARQHGMIEVGASAVVVGAQVKPEPEMLRNMIEKGRGKVPGDER